MCQLMWIVVWGGLLVGSAWGQEAARLQFFDCGRVQFFGEACGLEAHGTVDTSPVATATPPSTTPAPRPTPISDATAPPSPPEALFTPETMAPGTPPLLLQLLQEPTEANARAFLDWQRVRLERMLVVQRLLQRLGQEQGSVGQAVAEKPDSLSSSGGIPQRIGPSTTATPCPLVPGADGRGVCALRRP